MPPRAPSALERETATKTARCLRTISGLDLTQSHNMLGFLLYKARNDGELGWFETLLDCEVVSVTADDSSHLTGPAVDNPVEETDQEEQGHRGETVEPTTTRQESLTEAEGVKIKEEEVAGEQDALDLTNAEPSVEDSLDVLSSKTGLGHSASTEERSTLLEERSASPEERSILPQVRPTLQNAAQPPFGAVAPHGIDVTQVAMDPYLTIICGNIRNKDPSREIRISRDLLIQFSPSLKAMKSPQGFFTASQGNVGFLHLEDLYDLAVNKAARWLSGQQIMFSLEDSSAGAFGGTVGQVARETLVHLSAFAHIFDIASLQGPAMDVLWQLHVEKNVAITRRDLDEMWRATKDGCPARKLYLELGSKLMFNLDDEETKEEYHTLISGTNQFPGAPGWYVAVMRMRQDRHLGWPGLVNNKEYVFKSEKEPRWGVRLDMRILDEDTMVKRGWNGQSTYSLALEQDTAKRRRLC